MTTAPLIFDQDYDSIARGGKSGAKDRTNLTAATGNDNFHNGALVVEQLACCRG